MSPETLLIQLGIRPGHGLTSAHRKQIADAGYDLDMIVAEQGLSAERLHDAAFMAEEIARITLGSNYERLIGSIDTCRSIARKLAPLRVADLGGACGIVCFIAATENPVCQFVIIDRSHNALSIGEAWAQRFALKNISFVYMDFQHPDLALFENNFDLVLLEYVLNMTPDGTEEDVIAEMTPAVRTASKILRPAAVLQVRFGDFLEVGITALVRTAFRYGLAVQKTIGCATGCTILFAMQSPPDIDEQTEAFRVFEDLASQVCIGPATK
jgi:hypothetical protein